MEIATGEFYKPTIRLLTQHCIAEKKEKRKQYSIKHRSYAAVTILLLIISVESQTGTKSIFKTVQNVCPERIQKAKELSTIRDTIAHGHGISDFEVDFDEDFGMSLIPTSWQGDTNRKKYQKSLGANQKTKELKIEMSPKRLTIKDIQIVINELIEISNYEPIIDQQFLREIQNMIF